ncbi:CD209 antigen-like protein C isoform X2 [Hyla sarda]|uniref:CD209 antigen-like protein C isoform X2 n=1 Tax=Hyla sarda TaxID=327740 RepID=UPI0024C25A76|nr:CD209 antigen-like protein C isoform X2 [Hyla sarda]
MKNLYERSLDDSNTDMDGSSSNFNETFFSYTGRAKKSQGWIILALVVTLGIIFIILGILTGILFGHYSTMNDELTVLKYNVSDPVNENNVLELWKAVSNIMGDLSRLKDKVDITDGGCKTCPPGWKMIRSNCYYLSSTSQTWERSKELCAERNGILMVIKNEFEMTSLWPTIKQGRYWIGLRRDPKDIGMWLWTDGSPLTYSVWNEGEPNNDRDNEHCAEIMGGVQAWNDRPCMDRVNFICKGVWSC